MAVNMLFLLLFCSVLFQGTYEKPLDINFAKEHLRRYGYLNSTSPSEETFKDVLKKFQQINGLEVTGSLNNQTINRMKERRCGRPSNVPEFATSRGRWQKTELTYKIHNWTESLTKPQIKKIFDDSIKIWTDNVNLKITETTSDDADILITFTEQDGRLEVLGYAYYPENGDIFFDIDEDWTLDKSEALWKTYFGWVAAHEMGHSLGLPHSETMASIMFPYYSIQVTEPAEIDTQQLRSIYGEAIMNNTMLCSGTSIDAILDRKSPLIIKGKEFWIISKGIVQSGPFSLDVLFQNLPDQIDAAFTVGKANYFFSENAFYKFKERSKVGRRKLISIGFDNVPSNINAAFYDSSSHTIYFFKGSKYYAFDTKKPVGKRLVINGKDISNDWNGLPNDIEAATHLKNSEVLFIKKSKCYVVNMNSKEVVRTEDCAFTFYKC